MNPKDIEHIPEGSIKVTYAKNQPEYLPLVAIKYPDGKCYSEWELSDEELLALAKTKKVRLWCWTFNQPLQPVALEVV